VLLRSSSWLSPDDFRGLIVGLLCPGPFEPAEVGVLLVGERGEAREDCGAGDDAAESGSGESREFMSIVAVSGQSCYHPFNDASMASSAPAAAPALV
jgi:hypothetical protein